MSNTNHLLVVPLAKVNDIKEALELAYAQGLADGVEAYSFPGEDNVYRVGHRKTELEDALIDMESHYKFSKNIGKKLLGQITDISLNE